VLGELALPQAPAVDDPWVAIAVTEDSQWLRLRAVNVPTLTWLIPRTRACVRGSTPLLVAGGSPRGVRSVAFFVGHRRISKQRGTPVGVYATTWRAKKASRGRHLLRAVLTDRRGRRLQARRVVRVCRR